MTTPASISMQRDLQDCIIDFLSQQNQQTCYLKDIVKGTRAQKLEVNRILYNLKKIGVVEMIQGTPPVWKMVSNDISHRTPFISAAKQHSKVNWKTKHGKGLKKGQQYSQLQNKTELIPRILNFMRTQKVPVRSITIAKHLGFPTSSAVNPCLYQLQRKGLITQASNHPLVWTLAKTDADYECFEAETRMSFTNVCNTAFSKDVKFRGSEDKYKEVAEYSRGTSLYPNVMENRAKDPLSHHSVVESVGMDERFNDSLLSDPAIISFESQKQGFLITPEQMEDDSASQNFGNKDQVSTDISVVLTKKEQFSGNENMMSQPDDHSKEKVIVSHVSGKNEDKETETPSAAHESEDVDKILKVLLNCPLMTAKSFIIAQKMNSKQENILQVLDKCKKEKYISYTEPSIWTMSEEGLQYIKKKLGQESVFSHPTSKPVVPPQRNMSKIFTGPPPTPHQIIQNSAREGTYSSNCTSSVNTTSNISSSVQGIPAPGSYPTSSSVQGVPSYGGYPTSSSGAHLNQSHLLNSSSFSLSNSGPYSNQYQVSSSSGNYASSKSSLTPGTFNAPGSYQNSRAFLNRSHLPAPGSYPGNRCDTRQTPSIFSDSSQQSHDRSRELEGNQTATDKNETPLPFSIVHHDMSTTKGNFPWSAGTDFPQGYQPASSVNTSFSINAQMHTSFPSCLSTQKRETKLIGSSLSQVGCTEKPFRPPPTPIDLVQQQLKKTDISHSASTVPTTCIGNTHHLQQGSSACNSRANIPVSENLANAGIQRLLNAVRGPSEKAQSGIQTMQQSNTILGFQRTKFSQINDSGHDSLLSREFLQAPQSMPSREPHSLPNAGPSFMEMPSITPQPSSLSVAQLNTEPSGLGLSSESFAALSKNPVSALMEYAQSRKTSATIEVIRQSGPSHRPKFVMGAFIGQKQLSEVTCSNKKDGRKEAADKALRALIASGQYHSEASPAKPQIPLSQMTHFDKMAALTHQAFNSLSVTIAENFSGRKVIAGLVMKTSEQDEGTVISIGTGNRCITGTELSLEGNTVNDSHAEIITRRGFIRFLYKQLLSYNPDSSNQLFVPSSSGKLRIRDHVTFHLYISTAPCGDGALFSSRDAAANNVPPQNVKGGEHDPIFTSDVQGLLRTKIEGGEGTIPIEKDFVTQTFDGIQRGERLRTMSCTDKICRWNVVGMQGALLSHFIDPVYLDSLTLGTLYDHRHLARAVCCRVTKDGADVNSLLPRGYHLNHAWLGRVTVCDVPRETQKTKSLSLNWSYGDTKAEVTDGTKGLCYTSIEKSLFSRCSKRFLYDAFKDVCQKLKRQDLLEASNYNEAKTMATEFVAAKKVFIDKMKEYHYGPWVSKPIEEELFN